MSDMDLAEALRIDDPRGQMNRNQEAAWMVWKAAQKWRAMTEDVVDAEDELVDRLARAMHAGFILMDGADTWNPDYDANVWVGASWRDRVRIVLDALVERES